VEYAGDEASVAEDVAWLERTGAAASFSSVAVDGTAVDRLAVAQRAGRVRARIAVLPSGRGRTCAPLLDAGVGLAVHAGAGLVYAISNEPSSARVFAAIDTAVAAGVAHGGAEVRFEELPLEAKQERDVFGDPGPRLPLLSSLKRQFDPTGTLNPGRFQGRT
jgi:FAD/FMN-containing dehydrogenase